METCVSRASIHFILVALTLSLPGPPARGDESAELFQSLFGDRVAQARRTFTKTDDVELAKEILAVVESTPDSPELITIVCRTAHELASADRSGDPTALQAMEVLGRLVPGERSTALAGTIAIQRRQVTGERDPARKMQLNQAIIDQEMELAGLLEQEGKIEEAHRLLRQTLALARSSRSPQVSLLGSRLARLSARKAAVAKIEILKERLKADPKDTDSARELVRALVVDLDDPTAARKYSFLLPDDTERATIKLAAKPAEMRTAAEALAVARWYEGLAKSNEATHMLPMYKRAAESYLQSLIRSIASQDLAHVHARIALTNITQVIEKLETDLPGAALNPVAWTTGAA